MRKEGTTDSQNNVTDAKRFMYEALLLLLQKEDFSRILVKELCEKAGVNRSTFYMYYETKDELLEDAVRYMKDDFLAFMNDKGPVNFVNKIRTCPINELYLITPEYLIPYLNYIREHRRIFSAALNTAAPLGQEGTYDAMFGAIFEPILKRFNVPEKDRAYIQWFYISGLVGVIRMWVQGGCKETPEDIARVMQLCIPRSAPL